MWIVEGSSGVADLKRWAGLAGADIWLKDIGKEYKLKEAIEPLQSKYDYIIIDTPPASY